MAKPSVICLMGPTASGKTALAIGLCEHLPIEIVSVDSAMIYSGMDIGTAKPSKDELMLAPHRLIDIRDPAETYSVAEFVDDVMGEIQAIHQMGKIPLLTGGTMMYFKALVDGLSPMPSTSIEHRLQIDAWAEQEGWPAVHERLQRVDPEAAAKIHPNHSQRVSRALEVFMSSGVQMSQWQAKPGVSLLDSFDVRQLCICPQQRSVLHERIARRFELMLNAGFIQEVEALRARGDLQPTMSSLRAVGYRQVWQYLAGELDYDTMVEKGLAATRQLAKRQLTWLRGWESLHWLDSLDESAEPLKFDEILSKTLNVIGQVTI